jgi:hypothetical protein
MKTMYSLLLYRFAANHYEKKRNKPDECNGWILKTPFSYNKQNKVSIKTIDSVIGDISVLKQQLSNEQKNKRRLPSGTPYIMMQPMMVNLKEYKIVLFNGKVCYIAQSPSSYKHGFAFSDKNNINEMMLFAEKTIQSCFAKCPYMIIDGLVRVDVFETQDGRLVVNEFESLEAQHDSIKAEENGLMNMNLDEYWFEKLQMYLKVLLCD